MALAPLETEKLLRFDNPLQSGSTTDWEEGGGIGRRRYRRYARVQQDTMPLPSDRERFLKAVSVCTLLPFNCIYVATSSVLRNTRSPGLTLTTICFLPLSFSVDSLVEQIIGDPITCTA